MAFRVDASTRIGAGHLMRCLTLAEALRRRGAEVRFVSRSHTGNLHAEVRTRRIALAELSPPPGRTDSAPDSDYAAWLGVGQAADSAETIAALGGTRPDWLVVDHYSLGEDWERALRPHVGAILAIDDRDDRPHDCDMLLNQNCPIRAPGRHANRVPDGCRLLLGPRHALLRPEFHAHRRPSEPRSGQVRRVFVYFGGTDPGDVTGRTIEALSSPELAQLHVDAVVGPNYRYRGTLEALVARRARTRVHDTTGRVAELMARADLAVGAGGGTTWERLCLGLPSLVVSIAENQLPSCRALADSGLIRYLGRDAEIGVDAMRREIAACLRSPADLARMSAEGQALVDGHGASRVAECLFPTPAGQLALRPAQAADARTFHAWVNDAEARRQSFRTERIEWPDHRRWFEARLASASSRLFVLQAGDLPVGQIRFDLEGSEARIDFSIDALFRGRGWGRAIVESGMRALAPDSDTTFRADVKPGNSASGAVFRRLGFEESAREGNEDARVFRRRASAAGGNH